MRTETKKRPSSVEVKSRASWSWVRTCGREGWDVSFGLGRKREGGLDVYEENFLGRKGGKRIRE